MQTTLVVAAIPAAAAVDQIAADDLIGVLSHRLEVLRVGNVAVELEQLRCCSSLHVLTPTLFDYHVFLIGVRLLLF